MAIALVSGTTKTSTWLGASASPRGQTPSQNVTVGNKVVVWAFFSAAPGTVTVTDNSTQAGTANTYTQVGSPITNGTTISAVLFYCDVSRAILLTDTISVAWTGGSLGNQINISEWSGVATGAAASSVTDTGSSTSPLTTALSAATAGDLVIGGFGLASAQTFTVGTDGQGHTMTSLHAPTAANSRSSGVEYLVESGTSAYNLDATWGGTGAWAARGARFNAASAPPANTVAPVVSGTFRLGQVLTTTDGTWTNSPTITYQWKRDGSSIGSATASTYTVVAADVGHVIKSTVTGTNGSGNASADSNSTTSIGDARTAVMGNARIEFCANDMVATRNVGALPGITYPLVPDGSPFLLLNP